MPELDQHARTRLVLGAAGVERLQSCRVAVFGVGGVGGHCCEALARAGIGAIDLIDNDTVSLTNLNRQLVALHSTIGMPKVDVMADRIRDIDPTCSVTTHRMFYLPETADRLDLTVYDYVVDAIDTVSAKLELIERCSRAGTPIISAMGAGSKLDPTRFRVCDIAETSGDPLARVMRRECRKRGVQQLRVVYSTEPARRPDDDLKQAVAGDTSSPTRRDTPGSVSFVPSVMGMILAGAVIRSLSGVDA